nr:zinc finger, CCHC-type [Tanacetum cinerariifolium]GEY23826.1 zinc finger, CCHC-type [Tanacetum cinerariifolium]
VQFIPSNGAEGTESTPIVSNFGLKNIHQSDGFSVSCRIPSGSNTPVEELTLVELDSHLHIEESLRTQENDKPKGNNVAGPLVINMVEHNNSSRYYDNRGKRKHHDTKADPNKNPKVTCWKCGKPGHLKKIAKLDNDVAWWVDSGATVHACKDRCWFKTYKSLNDGSILHMGNKSTALVRGRGCVDLRVWGCRAVVRLPDPKLKTLGKRGIKCIFVGYAEHSKAFSFYVIGPNESIVINSIIESKDAIFDENRCSSVPRPSQRSLINGTEDSGGSVVLQKVTNEVVQQLEPELRKSKRHRTLKNFGLECQLYLIEGTKVSVKILRYLIYMISLCFGDDKHVTCNT